MSLLTPEVLDILQQNSGNIRNICVLAHVDHGKTTLTDHLLTTNGIISSSLAGKVRMMDSRADEQEREITMKSSSIALAYRPALPAPWQLPLDDASVACDDDIAAGPCAAAEVAVAEQTKALAAAAARRPGRPGAPAAAATAAAAAAARAPVPAPAPAPAAAPAAAGPRRPHYLINVIDSPGHVDFSSEVASAVRLSDGAVVLVDVVEGLSVQTQAVLQQAWAEGVRPCLVLNKVDRLVGELKLTENEALEHCRRVIEQVNAVASTFLTAEAMDGAAADAVAAAAAASSSSEPAAPEPEPTEPEPEPEAEDGKKAHKKDRKSKHGSSAHDSAADAGNDKYAVALDETRQWVFDPARGNVAFVSAWDSWGFTVQQFAQRYRGLLELPSVRAIPAIKEVAAAAVAAAAAEAGSESAWDGDWDSLPDSAATAAVSALLWGPYGWDSHAGAVVDTSPAAVAAAEAAAEASAGKEKKEKKEKKSDKSEKKDKKEKKSDKSDKKSKKSSAPSDSSSSGVASAESHAAADSTPLFVALVLRPIWALYAAAAEQSMEDVQAIVDAYGIAVTASGIGPTVRNFKTKIQNCFARWLPINEAVLGMSVSMLPSPKSAQKDRMQRLMPKLFSELPASDTDPSAASEPAAVKEGPVTELAHGVWTCDRACPHSLVSVVKVIDLHSLGPGALGTFATAPAAVGSVAGAVGVRGEYQRGRVGLAQPQGERGAAARATAAAVAAGGNGQGGSAVFFPGQQSQHEDGGIDAFSLLPGDDDEDDEPAPAAARTGPRFLAVARVFAGTLASADAPGAAPISPDATVTLFGPRYSGPKTRKSHDDGSDDDDEEEEAAAAAAAAADALGVSSGTALAALGSGGDDGNTATLPQSRLNFYTLMGGENQPVSRAYAGNVIGITGIDDVVFKSFTMSSLATAPPLRPLVYQALPIVRVVVETEDLTKAKALEAALRVLAVIDPNVHVGLTEQGELFVAASGELHLERCMRDLTDTLLPGVALRVHPPSVAFRETIVDADAMTTAATAAAAAAAAAPAAGDKDKEKDKEKEKEKGKKGGKSGSGGGLLRVTTPNGCVTVRMRLAPLPETVTRLLDTSAPHLRSARSKIDASRAGLRRLLGSVLARANGLEEDEDDDAATTALSSGAVLSRAEREVFASLRKAFQAWGVDQNGGTPPVPAPASDDAAAPVADSLAAAAAEGPVTVADFIALDAAPSVRKLMESGDICDYICAFGPKKWGPNLLVNKVPGLALATSAAAAAAAGAGAVVPGKWARGLAWLRAAAAHGVVVVEDEDAASVPATLVPVPAIGANEEKKQADMTVTRSQLDALEAIARFTRTAEHGLMQGFQLATAAGPICGEPMTGVCVSIEQCETIDWITDEWGPDPSGPMQGQVLTAIKDAIHVAFTARPRRIVEAVFAVTMQCTEEHLGRLFSVLSRRRGRVVDDTTVVEGTGFFQIKALLPVQSSFGFATDVREQTGGVTNPLLVFSHWEVIPDDPYYVPITEDDIEEFGVGGDLSRNVAKDIVTEVRKRKGLWVDEKVVAAPEKQRTLARKK